MSATSEAFEIYRQKLVEAQRKGDTIAARKWARLLDLLLREE